MNTVRPSLDEWLDEIKRSSGSEGIGVFFIHDGVVRGTTRSGAAVSSLELTCNRQRLNDLVAQTEAMPGVVGVRAWVNEGTLSVGEDIICALVAGDIRKNVFSGWQTLVRRIKSEVIVEREVVREELATERRDS
jgi:molybdopterin synthase catalytic subunit